MVDRAIGIGVEQARGTSIAESDEKTQRLWD